MSDKIKKLANTLIIFNNSSDVMMTSFIIWQGSGTIRRHGSVSLKLIKSRDPIKISLLTVFNFSKTCVNRGNRDRNIDLVIKVSLASKKFARCESSREINTVKNWTQRLPFGHYKVLFFSLSSHLQECSY